MKKMLCLALMVLLLSGCVSFNNAMTPSPVAFAYPFDGKMRVVQQLVSAASGLAEDWHTLGFEWSENNPNEVLLVAHAADF